MNGDDLLACITCASAVVAVVIAICVTVFFVSR
jgi:hypothetical protein